MKLTHTFRWVAASGVAALQWTGTNLLRTIQIPLTATTTCCPFSAIRLKRIQVWGTPTVLGNEPASASIEWAGGNQPHVIHSDTSMGIEPIYIDTKPPKNSSAGWWKQQSGTDVATTIFILTAPIGSVVDITLDLRMVDGTEAFAGKAGTGLTAGQFTQGSPDVNLNPVGYQEFSTTTTLEEPREEDVKFPRGSTSEHPSVSLRECGAVETPTQQRYLGVCSDPACKSCVRAKLA